MADDRRLLEAVAAAVADGDPIDRAAVGRQSGPAAELLELGQLFAPSEASGPLPLRDRRLPAWASAIELLAGLHVAMGLVGLLLARQDRHPFSPLLSGGLMLAFGLGAIGLLLGGRRDPRAGHLGAFFLIVASAFSRRFHAFLPDSARALLGGLPPDAFLPWFLWQFLREFPRAVRLSRLDRVVARGAPLAVGAGGALLASQLALAIWPALGAGPLALLARDHDSGAYWAVVFGLCLPALLTAPWRARAAEPAERARALLVVGGLALGALPVAVDVLVEIAYPPMFEALQLPENRRLAAAVHFLFLLLIPATAAYAVLVDRVMDVRLALPASLRQALARGFPWLAAVPAVVLLAILVARRDQPLSALFVGSRGRALWVLTAVSLVLLRYSDRWAARLDRALFPGRNPERALAALAEAAGLARGAGELASLVAVELRRGAAVEAVSLLVAADEGRMVPLEGPARSLQAHSAIVSLLRSEASPLEVDPRDSRSLFHLLPEEERQWVADGNVAMILPLTGVPGSLTGLVAVGPKESGLGFSPGDRLFLSSVATSATLALEGCRLRDGALAGPAARAGWADQPASQCGDCGSLGQPGRRICDCGAETLAAPVPYLLAGKFRLDRLLGRGGMGLVFRAMDLDLHRRVAVKTLPRVSSEATLRLRREARAMAAVAHPHLALIFGAESWRGTPILVVEYLSGGTLAERLCKGPLPVAEALSLVRDLCAALDAVHRAGLLHRDVKPSNIGFAEDGQVKLLDFGLARWAEVGTSLPTSGDEDDPGLSLTASRGIAGTLLYLSPDAIRGERPTPAFDVWALSVVLYECLAGVNPFEASEAADVLDRIRRCEVPPIEERRPECPEAVAGLLADALGPSRSRRPGTAADLGHRLARLVDDSEHATPRPGSRNRAARV